MPLKSTKFIRSQVELGKGALPGHMAFKHTQVGQAVRVYMFPNGDVEDVTAAFKLFMEDYQGDQTNYRDLGIFSSKTIKGPMGPGSWLINSKTNGDFFGFMPQIGISRSDGNEIPLRMVTVNTNIAEAQASSFAGAFVGNWKQGLTVAVGECVCADTGKAYQATTAGTTGATKPTHTSGTASDGGVTWSFLWDNAAGGGAGIKSFVVLGSKDDALFWSSDTTTKNAKTHITQDALVYGGKKIAFINNAGAVVAHMVLNPSNGSDLYIQSADGTKSLRLNFSTGFVQRLGMADVPAAISITNNSTTPNVTGASLVTFGNTVPTSITSFAGGTPNQILMVRSGNGQTTIVNGANIITNTLANKTLSANNCLMFVASGAGTVFTEIG